jgi:hypothetical protein
MLATWQYSMREIGELAPAFGLVPVKFAVLIDQVVEVKAHA